MRVCSIDDCGKVYCANGFCEMHYARHRRHGDPSIVRKAGWPSTLKEWLESGVVRAGNDECWGWRGDTRRGYGCITFKKKRHVASRAAYQVYRGEIPKGLFVRHTCDNPPCTNPRHLVLGTHAENAADRVERGRCAKGERCGRSKLRDKDVSVIKKMIREGLKGTEIAVKFGVHSVTICDIKTNKTWRHIE